MYLLIDLNMIEVVNIQQIAVNTCISYFLFRTKRFLIPTLHIPASCFLFDSLRLFSRFFSLSRKLLKRSVYEM